MKKSLLILLCLSFIIRLFGQLNPINNLVWEHDYIFPPGLNTFSLYWDLPESSSDTLIGYNIYGGNEVWRFQDFVGAECNELECPDGDFINTFLSENDFIKVTAVYNSGLEESVAIDSVQFLGLLVGVSDLSTNLFKLFPNPTTGQLYIDSELDFKIDVMDVSGSIILKQESSSMIDLSHFSKGIYFIKIITAQGISIEKIILE